MGKKHATTEVSSLSKKIVYKEHLDHVYMRPEVNSNRFEISNRFEKLFRVHGNFATAVYMAISLRPTLNSQTPFKNYSVYMAISLRQLSN